MFDACVGRCQRGPAFGYGNGAYVVSVEVGLELARQIQADVQRVAKDTYRTGKFAVGMMTSDEEE